MPCWYFDKKEIKSSVSSQQGIDAATEARYRREGARLIQDAGNKLGLRYDTCATGVVYFHRFYMFHSFKEFHRYVTAACCLFLAGKVEETPKKCKDIIRTCQSLLSPQSFAVFGENPREEVMTLERILLQTIKFDLQVEHPHAYLIKFAKLLKGDKEKLQKIVQMAWTFLNDSLCTTLCLQWEAEIIAVSLMYLASRLQKYEITDWHGKVPNSDIKWYEHLLEDLSMPLMEDVCHQTLDLYSQQSQSKSIEESPPPSPPKTGPPVATQSSSSRKSATSPPDVKKARKDRPEKKSVNGTKKSESTSQPSAQDPAVTSGMSTYNPYVDRSQYSSSFMSQEGTQTIQPLISGTPATTGYTSYTSQPPATATAYSASGYPAAGYPPPTTYAQGTNPQYTAPATSAPLHSFPPGYHPPAAYPPGSHPPASHPPGAQPYPAPGFPGSFPPGYSGSQGPPGPPPGAPQGFPPGAAYPAQHHPHGAHAHNQGPNQQQRKNPSMQSHLAAVRITGR